MLRYIYLLHMYIFQIEIITPTVFRIRRTTLFAYKLWVWGANWIHNHIFGVCVACVLYAICDLTDSRGSNSNLQEKYVNKKEMQKVQHLNRSWLNFCFFPKNPYCTNSISAIWIIYVMLLIYYVTCIIRPNYGRHTNIFEVKIFKT